MKRFLLITFILIILGAPAFAGHQGIPPQGCTKCHIPNLITQHGGFSSTACWSCHSSTDINVINTIARGGTVYCSDCHGTATHTEKHSTYMLGWTGYPGVEPGSAPLWTQVTSFTVKDPAEKEYQVCFKCHSYYAFGELPNGVTDIVGPSGFNLTDQAMEFNPANKSAHPVEVTLNNMTGSYAQKALSSAQMLYPWNSNVGNQNMQCSDCHEVNPNGDPAAPQGANSLFPLKGTGKYWPYKPDGTLWALNTSDASNTNLFCKNCHPVYSSGWKNETHRDDHHSNESYTIDGKRYSGPPCVSCHLVIPHGGKRSRFQAYGYGAGTSADVPPYIINQNVALLKGFKKASSPNNYDEGNCWSSHGACDEHNDKKMTYDP